MIQTIQNYATTAALAVLGVCLFAPCVVKAAKHIRREGLALGLVVLGFLYAAATKPSFTFESGLKNNKSYATNSTVHVAWTLGSILPSSAPVYIEYRQHGNTNAYISLASTTVGAYSWTTNSFANATNYDYNIWYDYTPPTPVHTNGVWQYTTQKTRDDKAIVPVAAQIEEK